MKNGVFWDVTHHVALVRNDVSVELSASIIWVTRIGELGTTGAKFLQNVGSYKSHTVRNIPEDGILHSHCRENLKSYISIKMFHNCM
jgi:hypothetical protein